MADLTGLSTERAPTGTAEVDACSLEIERKYDIIPAVICSMCCLFGIIYCFFGESQRRLPKRRVGESSEITDRLVFF